MREKISEDVGSKKPPILIGGWRFEKKIKKRGFLL